MFHIVICDDNGSFCNRLEENVLQVGKALNERFEVEIFNSGERFYEYLQAGHHVDLVFLDIEFPGKNGVEIGSLIRNERKDESILIVYVSSKTEYAMELFQNRPLHFLEKPLNIAKLEGVLQKALELSGHMKQKFDYILSKEQQSIWCRDILYFRSEGRKIEMVTTEGTLVFYGKLAEIQEGLQNSDFLRIHQSYLIHTLYVKAWKYDKIQMTDGQWLPISKAHETQVRAYHLMYMKGSCEDVELCGKFPE